MTISNLKLANEAENKEIIKQYRRLLKSFDPGLNKSDKGLVRRAFEMAMDAHKDMRRKSGEPYIMHPISVAQICVKEMGLGPVAAMCALLHDVVEDTELGLDDIQQEFGKKVATIVDGLTKIAGVFDLTSSIQAENFKKLLLTLADDVRVILIKIADRLHNMRTMDSMPRRKQLKIASETEYLYAPLAHRLGFYAIKSELEDLSMKYRDTDTYHEIASKLNASKRERTRFINEFCNPIKSLLEREGIQAKVYGRPKAISSIWNKIKNKGVNFNEVYDKFAIRIVIDSRHKNEKAISWKVYSIVTDLYTPNPDRLRDWISTPKSNGYESLHTTVMAKGRWVEVQIRTERMEEIAEKGFAAHWKYKEGSADNALDHWLREIREMLRDPAANALDFLDEFRMNLYTNEIYVFTPKGDLKILPSGATALDFAFEIHSDIGERCIGAKVNHKLIPISHKLLNGDQVEIITSKKQKPSEDWLSFLITSKARSRTKSALKVEKRNLAMDGKEMLKRKFKSLKINYDESNINFLVKAYSMPSSLELFFGILNKGIPLSDLKHFDIKSGKLSHPPKIEPAEKEISKARVRKSSKKDTDLLLFDEFDGDIVYKFAQCCNPIIGDDVFGFITIGEGIKIHRTNCPNAMQLMSNYGYRIVKTKWTRQKEIAFLTGLKVIGLDDVGLINKITNIISGKLRLNMRSLNIDASDGIFEGTIKIFVKSTDELDELIQELKEVEGVTDVHRIELGK